MSCAQARAETFEIQTVVATVPGKPSGVPDSLKKYKVALLSSTYSKFSDGGAQNITLSEKEPTASAKVGKYTLDFTRKADSKVEVVVKDDKKVILTPLAYDFEKGRSKQLELSAPGGMYIIFLTKPKE